MKVVFAWCIKQFLLLSPNKPILGSFNPLSK
jgi:hypothetical protein